MPDFNPFSSRKRHIVPDYTVDTFAYGLLTKLKDKKTLPKGAPEDSLNWLTRGDRLELRRGYALLGTTRQAGVGKVTGLVVAERADGEEVPFFTCGRKVKYYDDDSDDTKEVDTVDVLPAAASGEDMALVNYHNLAGSFVLISSKNSGIYKIPVANPGTVVSQNSTTFRGKIKIKKGRTFLWDRQDLNGGKDPTSLYGSYIDKVELSSFPSTSNEAYGTGDGVTKTFAHTPSGITAPVTLHHASVIGFITNVAITGITKATQAVVTAPGHGLALLDRVMFTGVGGMVQINNLWGFVQSVPDANTFWVSIDSTGFGAYTAGGTTGKAEYFSDDNSGNLSGDLGGTGTVNYGTGAMSVTFSAAPPNTSPILCNYYTETATSAGYLSFAKDSPRTAGQGFIFPQSDDGPMENVFFINDNAFCFHERLTYKLNLTSDDTNATNEIYRTRVGLPYWRAACETGDGIPYVDSTDKNNPAVRILGFASNSQEIVPLSISVNLDLSGYNPDQAVLMEWGEYQVLAIRSNDSSVNNFMFVRLKDKGYWDLLDFPASVLDAYNGALIGGDPLQNNLYTFFSGLDDDGSEILNHWTGAETYLGVPGLKRCMIFEIDGLIGPDQTMKISLNLDSAGFVEIRDPNLPDEYAVQGNSVYIDRSQAIHVGGPVMGSTEIGGGSSDGDIPAYHFRHEFIIATDYFEYVQPKFEGLAIGWLQINSYKFKDIRYKGRRQALRYQTS